MKLRLLKCSICSFWYSPFRGHCPSCGASIGCSVNGRTVHVDVSNGKEIVKGFYEYRMSGREFERENV
jgi:hypothetical protein